MTPMRMTMGAGLRRILVAGALLALSGGVVPGASAAGVTSSGGGAGAGTPQGTIYFARITDPADTLAVAPDGSGLHVTGCTGDRTMAVPRRVLRIEPTGVRFPALRAVGVVGQLDEVRLVATDDGCANRVVLVDLPPHANATTASWSLDGRRVAAYVRRYGDDGRLLDQGIWVGETGGTCGQAVCGFHLAATMPVEPDAQGTPFEFGITYLRWSSDDRRVVYERVPNAVQRVSGIFVANLGEPYATAVTSDRQVVVPGGPAYFPAFSPVEGDDRIAFVQNVSTRSCSRNDIFVTTSAGGTSTRLSPTTAGICQLFDVAWSPDGQWFVYSGWSGALSEQQAIYRVKADGSGKPVSVASSRTAIYRMPTWRS